MKLSKKKRIADLMAAAVAAGLGLGGCGLPEGAPGRLAQTAPKASVEPPRNLDPPLPLGGGSLELDMMPGRLNKVPVSWVFRRTMGITSGHEMRFRTTGCAAGADTGMIVTWGDTGGFHTAFDNDGNVGDGNGRCSLIDTGSHANTTEYTVSVFSMNRGTSRATLQFSTDGGASWSTWATDDFGGALVRVGALQDGDFLEVQTPSDGVGDEGTHLLLFQPPPPGSPWIDKLALFSDLASKADRDPRVIVDGTWSSTENAVLIGKDDRSTLGKSGVEIMVDLVRGPLDSGQADAPLTCERGTCTGAEVVLPRGRYYASLFAVAARPLGSVTPGEEHFADGMGSNGVADCPHLPRGQGNGRAFTASLKRGGVPVQTRIVPRGLLGEDPALGSYNRVVFEIDADGSTAYSLAATDVVADISFFPAWRYVRNPEVNHIKVASWNFAYWAYDGNTAARSAILENAADLIGTRGDLDPAARTVAERGDQGPWQWEADAIGFQEFYGKTFPTALDRLRARTAYGWSIVNANTEISDTPVGDWVYYGPVMVNDLVRPTAGIKYSDQQLDDGVSPGRCNSRWEGSAFDLACPLGWVDHVSHNFYNRAVPAKLSARRAIGKNAGVDRPVAFFNWHLYHEDGAFQQRAQNVENLIRSVKYLMARSADGAFPAGACAFNKECQNDPRHHTNRFIIVGDSNMKNHQCGEFSWAIRRLREEFGYAIDVASATVDGSGRTFDMHYSGAPLTDPKTSMFGSCQELVGPWSKTLVGDGALDACPFQYQDLANFNAAPAFTTSSWYPWWAATSQNIDGADTGGSRYDVVFLVGRGWAYDDPVTSYRVMPHRDEPSPMGGGAGGGIEIGYNVATCAGHVTDGSDSYSPNVSVDGCGTGPGRPALRSDHLPVGARLRIYGR